LRRRKWYVTIAYKKLAPVIAPSERVAAINRGMCCFLMGVTHDGEQWRYDGNDIESYLKQMQRRRRSYQYDSKASNRWGHGRARTLRPIETLQGKAERWRQTKCQTIARRFARWCEERQITLVKLEDFSGIRDGLPEKLEGGKFVWDRIQEWPYFQLETRIASCLEEVGIAIERVPAHFISQRCPACGDVRPENTDLRRRRLKCQACGWSRNLDVAAAMNVLIRGGDESDSAGNGSGAKGRNGTARKPRGKSWKGNGSSGTGPQS
jgi:transposase